MAADSRINIVLDVDTRNTEQIEATAARLTALGRAERSVTTDTNRLSGRMDQLTGRMNSATGSMNKLNTASNMFIKHARKIMYLVIGLGIEFLAVTAALVSVNAAFAIGNAAVKLYNWGMQAVAGALAAAGAAAITAAAAFTEFNAAAQAFRFKDSQTLGSAISQSADALRMLQVNSTLATYGITALNQAYASFSKNAKLDPKAVKQLEMMADFGTGPNRAKSLAAAAEYISLIRKQASGQYVKDAYGQRQSLASQIGPEFEKAAKKYASPKKLLEALESGQLAKEAGVEGFGKTVNQTLLAQLKGYLTKAFVELSDAGRYLLEPVKKTMDAIFGGLTRAFRMVRGDLIRFGRGGLLDALENLSEKTERFAIKLFREFLPAAAGWWKRTGNFFKAFVNEFNEARRSLESMREGGSIVIDMFGKPLVQIFKRIGSGARAFAQLAKENKGEFLEFGDALKRIVDGFFDIGNALRKAFTAALPIISKVATVVGQVFETLAKVLNFMAMLGPIGGTMAVGAMTKFAMKGTRGARYERRMARGVSAGMGAFFGGNMGIAGNMGSGAPGGAEGDKSKSADWAYKGVPSAKSKDGSSVASNQTAARFANATTEFQRAVNLFVSGASPTTLGRGGKVNRSGVATGAPSRNPGQSTLEYQAEMKAWILQNGGFRAYTQAAYPKAPRTSRERQKVYRDLMGIPEPRKNRIPFELRGRRAGSARGIDIENEMLKVKRNLAPGADLVAARTGRLMELSTRYGMEIPQDIIDRYTTSRAPKTAFDVLPGGLYGPVYTGQRPSNQIGLMERMKLSAITKAKNFAATSANRARFGASLPGNMLRYLYNSVRPGSMAYKGTSGQLFTGGAGGIQGNLGAGGGGGGGGGPLPGSTSPSGPGVGNYVPTTGLRNWASNMMTNMFGPAWTGAPGQSKAKGLRNRFGNFMTGGALNQNAAKLMGDSARIAAHVNAGGDLASFFNDPNNADVNPAAIGKNGGAKALSKTRARMKALKMRGSAMGGGMLASIGTGMFLESGMGKKLFGDPAAQTSMQTGAMLMPYNPALGLGVGLGGAAWNAKTVGGGAAAGAGSGAMLAMAAGGGPVAMFAAAAVMATVGMWRSVANKNKMAREGAKAISKYKLMDTVMASVVGGVSVGNADDGRRSLAEFGKFVSSFEGMNKKDRAAELDKYVKSGLIDSRTAELMSGQGGYGKQAVGTLKRQYETQKKILNPMFKHYDDIMRGLQLATGKSAEEIMKLSAEAGVNLFDDTIKLSDAIKQLGEGMMQTTEQINQSLRDIAIESTDVFNSFKQSKEMEDALQAAGTTLRGGNVTTESLIDYYQKYIDAQQLWAPDAALEGFLQRARQFQTGAIYAPGGALAGVTPTKDFGNLVGMQLTKEQAGYATQLTTNIGQALADKNIGFESTQGGQNMLTGAVGALIEKAKTDPFAAQRLLNLQSDLGTGKLFGTATTPDEIMRILTSRLGLTGTTTSTPKAGSRSTMQFGASGEQALKTLSTGTMTQEMISGMDEAGQKLRKEILDAFSTASKSVTETPEWWKTAPDWYNGGATGGGTLPLGTIDKINGSDVVLREGPSGKGWYRPGTDVMVSKAGDTSTPRALRATLGAHSKFNSMLPGKRMITSSWREHALGSPSSDHATGRAFDLTGDNLQQYAKSINSSGGFAEFHGVAGQRHLHVVPPIGPIGDRSTPASVSGGASATYGGDTFSITVVESSDARATADEVVKRIMDLQKQARRRM